MDATPTISGLILGNGDIGEGNLRSFILSNKDRPALFASRVVANGCVDCDKVAKGTNTAPGGGCYIVMDRIAFEREIGIV